MKTPIFVIAACVAVATPTLALAANNHGGGNRMQERFQGIDQNNDGEITRDEAAQAADDMFERLDADGNGAITLSEFQSMKRSRIDQNNDGEITKDEAIQASAAMFERLDTDGDGVITAVEIENRKGGKHGGRRFERADADGDGEVTADEFEQARLRWFERMDSNGDDTITADEMESAHHGNDQRRDGPPK